jgi:Zn-dependent M28 family amino/carboxypeptidase
MVLPDSTFYSMNYYARKRSMEVTEDAPAGMPLIYISEKMAESLLDRSGLPDYQKLISELAESPDLTRYKAKQPEWSYRADLMKDATDASNVLGFLEGTDKKDEIIVLTAHYDHLGINKQGEVYNGADDDGSGVATILELAEAFSIAAKEGNRPRRSILFMLVSGEEKGLLGSEFYTEHPVFPLSQTVANLNIDMIGRVDKRNQEAADSLNYVYIIGSDKLSSDLHQINESANETFTKLRFDYTYNEEEDPNRFYYRSDHFNFAKNGVPVIFYFTGTHGDYHQPGDDVEKLHFDKIAKIGRLILATTWELANREDRIRLDKKAN